MRTKAFLTGAALSLAAFPALAQAQQAEIPAIAANHTLLSINAEGTSSREPDMATFNAGVTTQGATASEALTHNSQSMNAVFAALKRAGIAEKDVQTSNLSVNPLYAQPPRRPDGSYDASERKITGYEVTNNVAVRQRKLDDYGKVIDALVTAGANQVNGPDFTLSAPEAAQNEARTAAIKSARERAELYAKAAGMRVMRIVSISESGGYAAPLMVAKRMAMAESAPAPAPIAAGEMEVTARVSVQFELAP